MAIMGGALIRARRTPVSRPPDIFTEDDLKINHWIKTNKKQKNRKYQPVETLVIVDLQGLIVLYSISWVLNDLVLSMVHAFILCFHDVIVGIECSGFDTEFFFIPLLHSLKML